MVFLFLLSFLYLLSYFFQLDDEVNFMIFSLGAFFFS
jgi:hypothetical protein